MLSSGHAALRTPQRAQAGRREPVGGRRTYPPDGLLRGLDTLPDSHLVARLGGGAVFLWSPIEPDERLLSQVDALGPVKHLVSPNKIHYAHIGAWKRLYPEAVAWASPGARERAASQGVDVALRPSWAMSPTRPGARTLSSLSSAAAGSWRRSSSSTARRGL